MFKYNLQIFAEGEGNPPENNNGDGNHARNAGYTYEQLEEVANSRAERASRAALADFFRKQGMSEEEITTAINDYKTKKKESQPDISAIERERDEAKRELEAYKNNELLRKKGVSEEDLDYVSFKVGKLATDKFPFEKALDQFLKENPRYAGKSYRIVETSIPGRTEANTGKSANSFINDRIRSAARR